MPHQGLDVTAPSRRQGRGGDEGGGGGLLDITSVQLRSPSRR